MPANNVPPAPRLTKGCLICNAVITQKKNEGRPQFHKRKYCNATCSNEGQRRNKKSASKPLLNVARWV